MKKAKIYMKPYAIADDGRCSGFTPCLQLNDNGGKGLWHGGPGFENHWRTFGANDLEAAKSYAISLGYPEPEIVYG